MLNLAQIIGHLGRDPEMRYTATGDAVCTMSVATTETRKNAAGERQERTEWHRIVAWGKLAEICGQYLRKGSRVYFSGQITTRKYADKDGVDRYATEIRAREMRMLDRAHGGHDEREYQTVAAPGRFDGHDDDIPF